MTPNSPPTLEQYLQGVNIESLPDAAYDSLRNRYFQQYATPTLLQQGQNLESARQQFMDQSERPNKDPHPRLHMVGIQAAKSLLEPIIGSENRNPEYYTQADVDKQAQELERQGISPGPYEAAGSAIGATPYWMAGMGVAGAAGAAVEAGPMLMHALRTAAGGIVQGAYDAAAAPEGKGVVEGIKGAASGAAGAGAFEFGPSLVKSLIHFGLSSSEATAVESLAKGTAKTRVANEAAHAVADNPGIEDVIKGAQLTKQAAAKSHGVPQSTTVAPSTSAMSVVGADGKPYNLSGSPEDLVDPNLLDHLKQGGEIQSLSGSVKDINEIQSRIESGNGHQLSLDAENHNGQAAQLPNDEITQPAFKGSRLLGRGQWQPVHVQFESADDRMMFDLGSKSKYKAGARSPDLSALSNQLETDPKTLQDALIEYNAMLREKAKALPQQADSPLKMPAPSFKSWFEDWHSDPDAVLSKAPEPEEVIAAPPLDQPWDSSTKIPRSDTPNQPKVRGSADVPLNANGQAQADYIGERLAAKGGLHSIASGDRMRAMETAQRISSAHPGTNYVGDDPNLNGWASGYLEGGDLSEASKVKRAYVTEQPDTPIPGASPYSGQLGESYNGVKSRVLDGIKMSMEALEADPDAKIGVVTHNTPINIIRGWLDNGAPEDLSIDDSHVLNNTSNTNVVRVAKDSDGNWTMRAAHIDNDQPLKGGIYLIKPGETDWNEPNFRFKDTPSSYRYYGDIPALGKNLGSEAGLEGSKPTIMLSPDATKETLFHENFHGGVTALGLRSTVASIANDSMADTLFHNSPLASVYPNSPIQKEEVLAHLFAAIRTNNSEAISLFGEADSGEENVLSWATEKAQALLDKVSEANDTVHKRTLERRLNAVVNRSTNMLQDVEDNYGHQNLDLDFNGNYYSIKDGKTEKYFGSWDDLVTHLEDNHYREPLTSTELVDTSFLPDSVPRLARRVPGLNSSKPPSAVDPMPSGTSEGGTGKRAGILQASAFFRPTDGWIHSVADHFEMPELYQKWRDIDDQLIHFDSTIRPLENQLKEIFEGVKVNRRADFRRWFFASEDSKPSIERELGFTDEEVAKLDRLEHEYLPQLPGDFKGWATDKLKAGSLLSQSDSLVDQAVADGTMDVRDKDLLRLVYGYTKNTYMEQLVKPHIDSMRDFVKGSEDLVHLKPMLGRKLDSLLGRPDITQNIVSGVGDSAIELYNNAVNQVNKVLPKRMHLEPSEWTGKEAIDHFLTFSYAGMLGLKPATLVRNLGEYFTNTAPVAGMKYVMQGMREAYPAFKDGEGKALIEDAMNYGALVNRSNMRELIAGGGSDIKLEKWSEKTLGYLQWSHNATRLASWKAFTAKVSDALTSHWDDPQQFIKESGLWFVPKGLQQRYLEELATLDRADWVDFSKRAATSLVDSTQWNYRRGATPLLYQYQLGRLFGQYGTWPLNYIEYGRRFAKAAIDPDVRDKAIQGLTRLAIIHSSILAAGHTAGIDTSHWVFLSPGAYGGGPILDSVVSAPAAAFDWHTARGEEARGKFLDAPWALVPGADEFKNVYETLFGGNPHHRLTHALGFQPIDKGH